MTINVTLDRIANKSKITHAETGDDLIQALEVSRIQIDAKAGEMTKVYAETFLGVAEIEAGQFELRTFDSTTGKMKAIKSIEFADGTILNVSDRINELMKGADR